MKISIITYGDETSRVGGEQKDPANGVWEASNSPAALQTTNKMGLQQLQWRGVHSQNWGTAVGFYFVK